MLLLACGNLAPARQKITLMGYVNQGSLPSERYRVDVYGIGDPGFRCQTSFLDLATHEKTPTSAERSAKMFKGVSRENLEGGGAKGLKGENYPSRHARKFARKIYLTADGVGIFGREGLSSKLNFPGRRRSRAYV